MGYSPCFLRASFVALFNGIPLLKFNKLPIRKTQQLKAGANNHVKVNLTSYICFTVIGSDVLINTSSKNQDIKPTPAPKKPKFSNSMITIKKPSKAVTKKAAVFQGSLNLSAELQVSHLA
jgi:hypothetical protein